MYANSFLFKKYGARGVQLYQQSYCDKHRGEQNNSTQRQDKIHNALGYDINMRAIVSQVFHTPTSFDYSSTDYDSTLPKHT